MTSRVVLTVLAASLGVCVGASSRDAHADPRFSLRDDDVAWIAGVVPGGWSRSDVADAGPWGVRRTHAFRRATAWIALFRGWFIRPELAQGERLRAFDLDTFALELVSRKTLPAKLPTGEPEGTPTF